MANVESDGHVTDDVTWPPVHNTLRAQKHAAGDAV